MALLEGVLLVPPERASIIGRAAWKPRYVVLSIGAPVKPKQTARAQDGRSGANLLKPSSARPSLVDVSQIDTSTTPYLSIYKAKGDSEHLAQYSLASFESSQVRLVQHRKQAPAVSTLMLEFKVDSPTERQRKRRSSRTGGLGPKDPWANTILLREAPDERSTIQDWDAKIKPYLSPSPKEMADEIVSPTSHPSIFTNPFAQRDSRAGSISAPRPDYRRGSSTPSMNAYPFAPRGEAPTALISPSPSLRSRRSDLSSQASSHHPHVGFSPLQSYAANVPSDLPSPASTSGYDAQFVEGWTSAQGRSSALSSHTRGSNSIASVVPTIGTTPPNPRETILDRAFQMRYIPGSERAQSKDEEKISSIARFEALMREVDERKQQKALAARGVNKSSFDLDEESEEESVRSEDEDEEEDEEDPNLSGPGVAIRSPAQRALDYISGRTTPLPSQPFPPTTRSPPIPFLNRSVADYEGGYRPHTGVNLSRRPASLAARSISSTAVPALQDWYATSSGLAQDHDTQESRRSGSGSTKRLSFQEFTKRLSSTSSLLLVQTNASSSPGKESSEYGDDEKQRGARAVPPLPERERDARRACRGSVGVFGNEGGFL